MKMRILHINCNYLGTSLHQLMVEELTSLGLENQVYVPVYDKTKSSIIPNDNVLVSECFNKWDRLVFDYKQEKIIRDIEEKIDVSSFDLIHAYTLFTDGNCARRLSEKYKIPFVVAVRNTDVNDFFKKMVHLRSRGVKTMLSAERIFFLSGVYRNNVMKNYVSSSKRDEIKLKADVIPNGINSFWLKNSYNPNEKSDFSKSTVKLIYAGVIDQNKNITSTVSAIRILKDKGINASLTVVGRVGDQRIYQSLIANESVRYYSACPKEELIQHYRNADLFVMPSHHETFGLVYAEAMSQGLPVIYTRGQGFDGQFPDGTVGFSVSDKNPAEIADRIECCLSKYAELSAAVVEYARKFDWGRICQQYCEIYSAIVNKRN